MRGVFEADAERDLRDGLGSEARVRQVVRGLGQATRPDLRGQRRPNAGHDLIQPTTAQPLSGSHPLVGGCGGSHLLLDHLLPGSQILGTPAQ